MGQLINAELRKILTTKMWWALLIPTVVLGVVWAAIFSAFTGTFDDALSSDPTFQQLHISIESLPLAVFALARAINITTLFPMLLGGLALSSEIRNRTITTTYLTAPTRGSVLGAKLITYLAVGLVYGLVIAGSASLGMLLGGHSHPDLMPSAGVWLGILGAGVLETVIWTLLAVGVGALVGNVIGTVLLLLLYSLVAENLLTATMNGHAPGFFPNQAGDGMTSAIASQAILSHLPTLPTDVQTGLTYVIQEITGARGVFDWWVNGLIFLAYLVIFFGLGWVASLKRDIT
ncbi:MAG TPA: hypothetical protein VHW44_05635 [Pseudonocardiaceae bacterium]|jgi:ABC-2 type transport system permease protein|nr:hypothetical protein [Pseudonocardiaceae bacterium]